MTDPYETLGVPKDADAQSIKRIYRRKAKEHHPDHGGDVNKITELTLAYDILSNPDKRKRYDETGKTEPDNRQMLIYAEFCKMCEDILLKNEGMPVKRNVESFKQRIESQYSQAKGDITRKRKVLEAAKARITKAPEVDPLGGVIAQRLDDLARQDEEADKAIDIARQALALFDQYEITEPEVNTTNSFWGMNTMVRVL